MQTQLSSEFKGTRDGDEAEAILRKCVHCGFCTATCPTYQLLGDELDGPRGRIYLIKQVLEGAAVTRSTQLHLDRCLTCRNCETTCPSGVEYGHLVDIGRKIVDEQRAARRRARRRVRWLLKEGLTSPLFAPAMKLGQMVRPLLPASAETQGAGAGRCAQPAWPTREHPRKVLMLLGCVQPAMMPNINSATARVLDAAGIQTLVADGAGCCGALRTHLNDIDGGLADMRRNIDAWWPLVEGLTSAGKVEAIVMNASRLRRHREGIRPRPGARRRPMPTRPRRISALTRDLSELLPELVPALQRQAAPARRDAAGLPSAVHAAARPAVARRRGDAPGRARLRGQLSPPAKATCAAARPAPTACCSPSWRRSCATASSAHLATAGAAGHRLGQHRLHPAPAKRHGHAGAALGGSAGRRAGLIRDRDQATRSILSCGWP